MRKGPEPRRTPAFATTLRRGLITTEYLYVKLLCPSVHTSYSRYSSNTILLPRYPSLNPKSRSLYKVPGLADRWSVLNYDPHGMDDPRDIAEERQKNVNPEVLTEPHLQEHPQRGEKNRDHEAQ